jgi:hypothetical protein
MNDTSSPRVPNHLEILLGTLAAGNTDMKVFMHCLMRSQVAIPSATSLDTDLTQFAPLIFEKAGTPFLAIFTDKDLMLPHAQTHPFVLVTQARWFFKQLSPGVGITLNPGYGEKPFELLPDVIPSILKFYAQMDQPADNSPTVTTERGPLLRIVEPENALEEALVTCRDAYITVDTLLSIFLRGGIYISSSTPFAPGSQFIPPVLDRNGISMMSAHSSLQKSKAQHPDAVDYKLYRAADVIKNFPPDVGLVLNLGHVEMLELPPSSIQDIKKQLTPA